MKKLAIIDEFDIESIPESTGTQSITLGSKMNHDHLRTLGREFEQQSGNQDEPPFA